MIEAYAFLVAFMVQILTGSVLGPARFARYARAKAEVQLPGWDARSRERFLSAYRTVNMAIAVLGLGVLGWLFNHMRGTDWDIRPVSFLQAGYSLAQMTPFFFISLAGAWYKKKALAHSPPEARRTASLQRRGLFDIVSPFMVVLAVLAYVLFAGFVFYIQQHPVAGVSGHRLLLRTGALMSLLGMITFAYGLNAFLVYWLLYRRKRWPLETQAYRLQAVEMQVKMIFYVSFVIVVFVSLNLMLGLLHLQRWAPFAMSVYLVIVTFFVAMVMSALRRQAETDRLATSPAG